MTDLQSATADTGENQWSDIPWSTSDTAMPVRNRLVRVGKANVSMSVPTAQARSALETLFGSAIARGSEAAWTLFVESVASRAGALSDADVLWLLRTVMSDDLGYRAASSLAQVFGVLAEQHSGATDAAKLALDRLAQHASAQVRCDALEAAMDVEIEFAQRLARQILDRADHPMVEQAARSVLDAR